ncbi:hypothetical protein Acr_15g0006040 [Actinidia rufa]|uniref:Uncharacterized protein n=1 Tax=Actinidia rufa TaxID=165716 RepID=A0A7J0FTG5_9ERIC|nr:hypothetical protein Acr_15g0006040 [Actinidia rufa]
MARATAPLSPESLTFHRCLLAEVSAPIFAAGPTRPSTSARERLCSEPIDQPARGSQAKHSGLIPRARRMSGKRAAASGYLPRTASKLKASSCNFF